MKRIALLPSARGERALAFWSAQVREAHAWFLLHPDQGA
jgi:hypothetical protein